MTATSLRPASPSVFPRTRAREAVALALIALLTPAPALLGQSSAAPSLPASGAQGPAAPGPAIQTSAPLTLHINIVEGEDALNNIRERTAREPIVQVEDANHKPVAGVAVIFTSVRGPSGAGGSFNSFTSYKTVTNAQGRAVGRGFQPNTTAGQFTINVQAAVGSAVSGAIVIHETNTLFGSGTSGSSSSSVSGSQGAAATQTGTVTSTAAHAGHLFGFIPKWIVVGVVAGGASAAAIAVVKTQNPTGAVISTGGGTVTAPARR